MKALTISRNAPLSKDDSPTTTYGCRHYNPNFCGSNGIEGTCAFFSPNKMCKKPPASWKKQYDLLKEQENN